MFVLPIAITAEVLEPITLFDILYVLVWVGIMFVIIMVIGAILHLLTEEVIPFFKEIYRQYKVRKKPIPKSITVHRVGELILLKVKDRIRLQPMRFDGKVPRYQSVDTIKYFYTDDDKDIYLVEMRSGIRYHIGELDYFYIEKLNQTKQDIPWF